MENNTQSDDGMFDITFVDLCMQYQTDVIRYLERLPDIIASAEHMKQRMLKDFYKL